jgi:hypothetical protein
MNARLAAAALALLALAAPAAAQPDPARLLQGAMDQLVRNHGDARDYTLVVAQGERRAEVFVHRREGEWKVETQEGSLRAQLLGAAVVWPMMANPGEMKVQAENAHALRYVGTETVDGRTAHVISGIFGEEPPHQQPDTSLVYVDAETRQILRVHFAGKTPPAPAGLPDTGPESVSLTLRMSDHRETAGVTIPRRLQMTLRIDVAAVDPEELAQMRREMEALRGMEGMSSPEMGEFVEIIELLGQLLATGELDLPVTVEEVRVNTGPPAWLVEQEAREAEDG